MRTTLAEPPTGGGTMKRIVLLTLTALALGCPNPAKDKPKAEVTEANEGGIPTAEMGAEISVPPSTGTPVEFSSEHGEISWVGSKVTRSHDGGFKTFSGQAHLDESGKLVGLSLTIDMDSVWSDTDRLTGHLKTDDFFDVANYPEARFVATRIVDDEITGNLTLRGTTKSITFPAQVNVTDDAVQIDSEFALNRQPFGVKYKGKPDNLVRDEVVLRVKLDAPRA